MNTKYLIFDFDGVLADSFQAISEYEQTKFQDQTVDQIKVKLITEDESHHFLDPEFDKLRIEYSKGRLVESAEHLKYKEIPLFLEFFVCINSLENTKLAIVTGNSSMLVKSILDKIDHRFEYISGVEDGYLKSDKIKKICQKWGVSIDDVIYFTDTQRDVYQLEKYMSKSKIYGCSWGWHGYERLSKVLLKENILQTFTDIKNLKL